MTSLIIEPERPAQHAAIRAVVTAAFGSAFEANIVDAVRVSTPHISLVATVADAVLGHVLFSEVHAEGLKAGALGPVAVQPARQNEGIGKALIEHGLALAFEQWPVVFVLGDPGYYGRFGFRPAEVLGYDFDDRGFIAAFQVTWSEKPTSPPGGRVVYHPSFYDG